MVHRIAGVLPGLAVMALGTFIVVAGPNPAFAQDAGTKAVSADPTDKAATKPVDKAEQRIKELHSKLHITQAEEPQWQGLVQVMRDNAQQMSSLIAQRDQNSGTTAVDNLKSYEEITDAHADGLKKLVPAFKSLYDALSDEQKKVADTLFRGDATHQAKS